MEITSVHEFEIEPNLNENVNEDENDGNINHIENIEDNVAEDQSADINLTDIQETQNFQSLLARVDLDEEFLLDEDEDNEKQVEGLTREIQK